MDSWTTLDDLAAARERFAAALPGWRPPSVHAIGLATADATDFLIVNKGAALTAVVLSTVCGHRSGTASYTLTEERLDAAIALLAPAEACTEVGHPNMRVWRSIRATPLPAGTTIVAVFIDDDLQVERLRAEPAVS
ncbi:hypothetical protein [Actinocorallia longicatena]|uniref:Uncharacterized protein n=1 Tax=Actinocorallia longicatena TaxID=111803 RepID=A0ABP6QBD4_9ACTN